METDPLIELRHVTVERDGAKILDDLSLTLHESEILGLVFLKGTGKTTLLRVASGFFKPDKGEVLFRGRDIATFDFGEQQRFQAKTGFVFQHGGLLVNTKCYDNVALPLRYHTNLAEEDIEELVVTHLDRVGLAGMGERFPFELTLPNQKLVTLARELVRKPEVIFYDNFFKGSDTEAWLTLTRLIREHRASQDLAWLLVLEADPSVYAIADHLAIIENGRVLEVTTPGDIRKSKDIRISRVFNALRFDDPEGGDAKP